MARSGASAAFGATWNYAAQIATVVVQLGYAAITSRLLPAADFGAYGVALTVSALITLLATAGLPQAVSRLQMLDRGRLSTLLLYAVTMGVAAAAVLFFTAPLWAALWGVPTAEPVLRVLAAGSLLAPTLALATGVLIRTGRFRALATVVFVCNVVGMGVGVVAVATIRTPAMLVISPVVAQDATAICCLLLARRMFAGRPVRHAVVGDLAYSTRMSVSSLLAYSAGNAGKLFVSNAFGAVALGRWNRADVITTTPFYQVQNAIAQALYPEFRHDRQGTERARRVWADLLGLVAWLCLPAAAVLVAVTAAVIPVVFGPGWAAVAAFTPILAITGGVQATVAVLVSALEVLGRFRWIWAGYGVALIVSIVGGLIAITTRSVQPALAGEVVGLIAMHVLQVVLCARSGLLQPRALVRHYAGALAFAAILGSAALAVVELPTLLQAEWWLALIVLLAVLGLIAVLFRLWSRLPVVRLAHRYGLLPTALASRVAASMPVASETVGSAQSATHRDEVRS